MNNSKSERRLGLRESGQLNIILPLAGLIALFVLFAFTSDGRFLTPFNMSNIINQACIIMVTGIGLSFIMSHNNLDLSCGGAMALCGVIVYLLCEKVGFWMLVPGCLIVGALIGLMTGCIHVYGRIPAFLAGFCVLCLGKGISTVSVEHKMRTPMEYIRLNNVWFYVAVLVAVSLAGGFVMKYTKIGKYNKLIGANPATAKLSGINVDKYKLLAFMINGIAIGTATIMTMVRAGSISNTTGNGVETSTLIAVVIGGMPLNGGTQSRVSSAVIGALIYILLNNGLIIWQVNVNLINVIKGIVFLAIVIMTVDRKSHTLVA